VPLGCQETKPLTETKEGTIFERTVIPKGRKNIMSYSELSTVSLMADHMEIGPTQSKMEKVKRVL